MIGVSLKIETVNETVTIPVTPRAVINFERHFKIGIAKAFGDQQKMEHLYWLGWECMRLTTSNVKPFEAWVDQCHKVSFASEGNNPLESATEVLHDS